MIASEASYRVCRSTALGKQSRFQDRPSSSQTPQARAWAWKSATEGRKRWSCRIRGVGGPLNLVKSSDPMRQDLQWGAQRSTGLVDVLDRVLDKGLVIAGDIKISLAEVELLTI